MNTDRKMKWKPPFYADGNVIRDDEHELVLELRGLTHLLTLPDGDMVVERRINFVVDSMNNEYNRMSKKYQI